MAITTIERLNLQPLKKAITVVLSLTDDQVVDDRSKLDQIVDLTGFIVIERLYTQEIGQASSDFDGDKEKEKLTSTQLTTIQVSAFGNNAIIALNKLKTGLCTAVATRIIRKGRAYIVNIGNIQNNSTAFGGSYEQRASFDVVLSHQTVLESDLERIKSVKIIVNSDNGKEEVEV